jgi:hypothetical protein
MPALWTARKGCAWGRAMRQWNREGKEVGDLSGLGRRRDKNERIRGYLRLTRCNATPSNGAPGSHGSRRPGGANPNPGATIHVDGGSKL